ncbi:hypothetical protein [Streptomyces venezuelae]|uniref:hypothetical protein n=1 Tax=Streptomyces venezuelae TaxID=54571 RepID=UPI00343C47F8
MLNRKSTLRVIAPIGIALCLGLSACSSGEKADAEPAPLDKVESSASVKAPKQAQADSPKSEGGARSVGQPATGVVKEDEGEVVYDITARKVETGTEQEAQRLVQDKAAAKGMVLAVAHVEYTHKSGPALTDSSDVGDSTTLWADGKRGTVLLFAPKDNADCEDPYKIDSWKQGESHTLCESFLVPADSKTIEVHWSEEDGEPFVWKFSRN